MAKIKVTGEPVSGAFTALTKPITPDELAGISKPVITSGLGSATSNINLDEFEGVKNNFLSGDDAKDLKGLEQTRYDNQSGLGLRVLPSSPLPKYPTNCSFKGCTTYFCLIYS